LRSASEISGRSAKAFWAILRKPRRSPYNIQSKLTLYFSQNTTTECVLGFLYIKELGRDVMQIARMTTPRLETGKFARPPVDWQNNRRLFQALKIAIDRWLTGLEEQLDLKSLTDEALDPATFGRAVADA
jgi:hypothetical protein